MSHHVSHYVSPRLAALAGVLAMLGVSLTLFAPSASASKYCGGKKLTNYETCVGAARNLHEVKGFGEEKSVCVGISAVGGGHCSGGPHQIAVYNYGTVYYTEPWIQDNAVGSTIVYGEAF